MGTASDAAAQIPSPRSKSAGSSECSTPLVRPDETAFGAFPTEKNLSPANLIEHTIAVRCTMTRCLSRVVVAVFLASPIVAHGWRVLPQSPQPWEERPLKLPSLRPGESCPTSSGNRDLVRRETYIFGNELPWFGRGPVFVALAWHDSSDNRAGFSLRHVTRVGDAYKVKTPWISEPSFAGPIMIRGRALDEEESVLEFDVSGEGRHRSLRLMAPNTQRAGVWSFWASSMWVPGPGCYGVQLDTSSGTQVVVFQAT
jgi:hypothetical protein